MDDVRWKLVLVDAGKSSNAAPQTHWRTDCSCEGDLTVDGLRPQLLSSGPLSQFTQALYCDRCGIGYVPEQMAKPRAPHYQPTREGWRRVHPDGTLGPPLTHIADDPDAIAIVRQPSMVAIEIGRIGIVTNSEHPKHHVRVVDDSASTGGFLIYEWWDGSNGPNENHAFDSWVETRADLEAYFREEEWNVEWQPV